MFGWNTFGVLFFGPAIATKRFFDTLNKVERQLNYSSGSASTEEMRRVADCSSAP